VRSLALSASVVKLTSVREQDAAVCGEAAEQAAVCTIVAFGIAQSRHVYDKQ
jgi:hypothetical protein